MKSMKTALSAFLVVILLAGGSALYLQNHTWAAGGFRAKDAEWLDLRGKKLSAAEYITAAEKLPQCRIVWDVPFQAGAQPSDASSITLSTLGAADVPLLKFLPNLTSITLGGCADYPALLEFLSGREGCQASYPVTLGGADYPNSAQTLTLTDVNAPELLERLACFPQLSWVTLEGQLPDASALSALRQAYPGIAFSYRIPMGFHTVYSTDTQLDLRGTAVGFSELRELAAQMPALESIDLRGCGLTADQLIELNQLAPQCRFLSQLQFGDLELQTDARQIDLSGHVVESPAEIEAILPCFPDLEAVVMCGCGLDNETMEALNQRYPDISFVWSVKIKNVDVRTDAKYFYPYKFSPDMVVTDEDLYNLRYCHDMEAIDIGHMTTVTSCEWVRDMPKMKYLILVETAITDISPLAGLKELVFLEIFTTKITDYSPLLECPALEDLNLGNTFGDPAPIMQMTWLKNLWWSGIQGTYGLPCSHAADILPEALPNTTMKFALNTPNVNNGWRQLDNYYAMRDLMDVFYLS